MSKYKIYILVGQFSDVVSHSSKLLRLILKSSSSLFIIDSFNISLNIS